MPEILPIRFHPVFRDYLWGGHRLVEQLNKPAGPGIWAESWEIVDHDSAQSVVDGGAWDGRTLGDLMTSHGPEIVGEELWKRITRPEMPSSLRGRFPLLIKFLDAAQDLSLQVHPNDHQAARLQPPDLGKTEAWYVLDADREAMIFAGLLPGVGREAFAHAVAAEKTAELLHSFHSRIGDCILVPAGTLHAIGAGNLILEVQQASNTTWRVFDWNRVDALGRRRELHIDRALEVADFARGPVTPLVPRPTESVGRECLVQCEYFCIHRWRGIPEVRLGGDGTLRILVVLHADCVMESPRGKEVLASGATRMLAASCPEVLLALDPRAELLEITAF